MALNQAWPQSSSLCTNELEGSKSMGNLRAAAAGCLHRALEGPWTWRDLRRNYSTKGRLDDWVLAKLVAAEQRKHLGACWVQPDSVSTAPGKSWEEAVSEHCCHACTGQESAKRLPEATTWVILTADKYPGGEWPVHQRQNQLWMRFEGSIQECCVRLLGSSGPGFQGHH